MALGTQLAELVDAFSELVGEHVNLARLELKADARFVGKRLGLIFALGPTIIVGYGFLNVALALVLRRVMPLELGFLLVGVANLVLGVGGISLARKQLGQHEAMQATAEELQSSKAVITARREPPR